MCMWRQWAATDGITSGTGGTKPAVCVCVCGLESRIETAGVQLLWAIRDHKPNGETREVLSIYSLDVATVDVATVDHTNRGTKRLSGQNDKHNFKLAYGYISAGRRNVDRPRERWRDRKPCGYNEHRIAQILLLLMTKALVWSK